MKEVSSLLPADNISPAADSPPDTLTRTQLQVPYLPVHRNKNLASLFALTLLQSVHLTDRGRFSSHNRLKISVTGRRVRRLRATSEKQSESANFVHPKVKPESKFVQAAREKHFIAFMPNYPHTRRKPT